MFRFPVIALIVPRVAFAALESRINDWWEDWLMLWGLFDPDQRRQYLDSVRELDADLIDRGNMQGGYAAGCGSDEA